MTETNLPHFFAHQQDAAAVHMAAFTTKDPSDHAAFAAHRARILASETIRMRTGLVAGQLAGHVGSWVEDGRREVTFCIGRAFWGRGVATAALRAYLAEEPDRPLRAHVAADNASSIRVLEKCGFVETGKGTWFAQVRGREIEEIVMMLAQRT